MASVKTLLKKIRPKHIFTLNKCFGLKICMLLLFYLMADHVYASNNIIIIDQAYLMAKDEEKNVKLPYELEQTDSDSAGDTVYFRAHFTVEVIPENAISVFIERLSLSGRVYVNGKSIGSCGPGPLHKLRCRHQPILLSAPIEFLKIGDNSIDVELYFDSHQRNGLSRIVIGPPEYLHDKYYSPKHFWSYDFILAMTWTTLSTGSIFLLVGVIRGFEPLYFWFGLASVLNALSSINLLVNHIWFDDWWTTWFIFSVRLASAPITFIAILTFFGSRLRITNNILIAYGICGPLIIALSNNSRLVVLCLYAPLFLFTIALLLATAYWSYQSRKNYEIVVTLMLYFVAITSIRDYYVMSGHTSFTNYYYASHSMSGMFLAMSLLIIKVVTDARDVSREIDRTLKTSGSFFDGSLIDKQKKLLEREKSNVRAYERDLILREMHDSIGSNLALAKIQILKGNLDQEKTSELFDECIDDLRLLIDASDREEGITYAIAKLRSRFNPKFDSCRIKANWSVHLKDISDISPEIKLNMMRIIQEALTNVIKHSQATELNILIKNSNTHLQLEISDNGFGFNVEQQVTKSRGLRNMYHRASLMGAEFEIMSGRNGTILTLPKLLTGITNHYY